MEPDFQVPYMAGYINLLHPSIMHRVWIDGRVRDGGTNDFAYVGRGSPGNCLGLFVHVEMKHAFGKLVRPAGFEPTTLTTSK